MRILGAFKVSKNFSISEIKTITCFYVCFFIGLCEIIYVNYEIMMANQVIYYQYLLRAITWFILVNVYSKQKIWTSNEKIS
ncbi:hypothetical protein Mh1962_01010 [Mannheimia haemolytica]